MPLRMAHVRAFARMYAVAWVSMTALILSSFANEALPPTYLGRPLIAASVAAVGIALVAYVFGRYAILAAVCIAVFISIPAGWPLIAIVVAAERAVMVWRRMRGHPQGTIGTFALTIMAVLMVVQIVRVAPSVLDDAQATADEGKTDERHAYILLMDGYPRIDTLTGLGIDNTDFIEQLDERGFDHYPNATSGHTYTHRTIEGMLAGSSDGIPDGWGRVEDRRAVRSALDVPPGFTAIDPGIGHVTLGSGQHIDVGGVNDFEIHLIGRSILGLVARDWTADRIATSMGDRVRGSLARMAQVDGRVFAHVMAPHPPYVLASGLPHCWPRCSAFARAGETGSTEWPAEMAAEIRILNGMVLDAIDAIMERNPDAAIVLFSDHGARQDMDMRDEWQRILLASRTPGQRNLYADEPHPHAILRLLDRD
ncbi:MAG: hypothetical protein LC798_08245 [Chloroflexi bacterium]|nr:hypothetical protein [Chloroflexota bacterium]